MTYRPVPGEFSGNSLVPDDIHLPNPKAVEFSGSPRGLDATGAPPPPLGLQPFRGGEDIFTQGLHQLNQITSPPLLTPRAPQPTSGIFYSPSTGDMVVNGFRFNQTHAGNAMQSLEYLRQPQRDATLPDDVGDWRQVSPQEYEHYIESIQNPGLGRRIGESFQDAMRGMGDIGAGAILAVDPNNQTAQQWRNSIAENYAKDAPYMLHFRDINSPGRAVEYFAQMLVQGVPWLVETAISMGIGALIGGTVSGGIGAPAGAVEGFTALQGIRLAAQQALRGSLRRGAAAYLDAMTEAGAATRTLTAPTLRQVMEHAAARGAATSDVRRFYQFANRAYHMSTGGQIGALSGMAASNYATGLGDIRNTIADAGGDPTSANAIIGIYGLAVPYALLESAGDLIIGEPLLHHFPQLAHGGSHIGNALRHAGIAFLAEGTEEASQDVVNEAGRANAMGDGMHLQPMNLLETFVAGGIGGLGIGGVVGALGPVDRTTRTPSQSSSTPPIQSGTGVTDPNLHTGSQVVDQYEQATAQAGMLGPEDQTQIDTLAQMPPAVVTPQHNQQITTELARLRDIMGDPQATTQQKQAAEAAMSVLMQQTRGETHQQAAVDARFRATRGVTPVETLPQTSMPNTEAELATPPEDFSQRQTTHIPQTPDIHPQEAADARVKRFQDQDATAAMMKAGDALVAHGGMSAKALTDIRIAMRDDTLIADSSLNQLQQAILSDATHEQFPVEHAAMALRYGQQLLAISIKHNQRVMTELSRLTSDMKNIATWPREKLQRAQKLTGQLLMYGKAALKSGDVEHLGQFQGLLYEALQPRAQQVATEATPTTEVDLETRLNEVSEKMKTANAIQKVAYEKRIAKLRKDIEAIREKHKGDLAAKDAVIAEERARHAAEQEKEQAAQEPDRSEILKRSEQLMAKHRELRRKHFGMSVAEQIAVPDQVAEDNAPAPPLSKRAKRRQNFQEMQARKAREAAEKANAVPERSAAEVPVREQPVAGEGVRSGDTEGNQAAGPRQEERNAHSTETTGRVAKAYEALKATGKNPLQAARGLYSRVKRGANVLQAWGKVDGIALTAAELETLITHIEGQTTETKADEKIKTVADEGFHNDLRKAFREDVAHPGTFQDFVLNNMKETAAWLTGPFADKFPQTVLRISAIFKNTTPQSVMRTKVREARITRLWKLIQAIPLNEEMRRDQITYEVLPRDWKQQIIDASGGEFRNNIDVAKSLRSLLEGQTEAGAEARAYPPLYGQLTPKAMIAKRNDVKQMATNEKDEKREGRAVTTQEALKTVLGVQKRIAADVKFRTVHVFKNIEEFANRVHSETMSTDSGGKVSFFNFIMLQAQLTKRENRDFDQYTTDQVANHYLNNVFGHSKALVVAPFDALVVFADQMESHNDLLETLEHEWIVHRGLKAIFDSLPDAQQFLQRLGDVLGMDDLRIELVRQYPGYANHSREQQLEELVAFHATKGPLALKALLDAPETIDAQTRKTIWQQLKDLVERWIRSVFLDTRTTADQAMDRVVAALRKYAITGEVSNLNDIIQPFRDVEAPTFNLDPHFPTIQHALAASNTSTVEKLFGTPDEAGRPHSANEWTSHMGGIMVGNSPLIDKVRDMASKGVGTSIREGWRKVGRNIETMDNMALRSVLIEKLMEIMRNTVATARLLMSKRAEARQYALKSAELAWWRSIWGDKEAGSTKEQRDAYNRMAIIAANGRMAEIDEDVIRAAPRLIIKNPLTGMYAINHAAFDAMVAKSTYEKHEFIDGIDQKYIGANDEVQSAGLAKLPKEVVEAGYDIYVKESRNMAESALETLEHALIMLGKMNDESVMELLRQTKLAPADTVFADEAMRRIYSLYANIAFQNFKTGSRKQRVASRETARKVAVELMRAFHEAEKVKDWVDTSRTKATSATKKDETAFIWRENNATTKAFWPQIEWFLQNDPDTGLPRIARMNTLGISRKQQFMILGAFQQLLNAETMSLEHENDVIQSVLGNYVEFTRKGEWRVFLEPIDVATGKRAELTADFTTAMPVVYPKSQREAIELRTELQKEFEGEHEAQDQNGSPIKIKFEVGYEKTPVTRTLAEAPNIRQFLEVADILGLKLSPNQMKRIADLIENAAGRKRLGLQRQGSPGMDADILGNNDSIMTRRAWWAAKMSQAWNLDGVFSNEQNLYGSFDHLKKLQDNFDIANRGAVQGQPAPAGFVRNEDKVYLTEQALLRYAHQLRHMAKSTTARSTVDINTTKGEKKLTIEPEANAHRAHGVALVESLHKNELEVNLNDLLSKTGNLRLMAVVAQLGTIASGIMNAFALITHLPFTLMARHSDTGYGEGFRFSEVYVHIAQAARDTGFEMRMTESAHVKELLDAARAGTYKGNLTVPELEFIYQETLQGQLMPNQTYSFTGGTESKLRSVIRRNLIENILAPFAIVEAANRRIAALASYRMMKDRLIAAGGDETKLNDPSSAEYKRLVSDINRVIFQTQGDYTNINRPKVGRGDLAQYVMMYKLFQIITTQMIYNLPRAQQLGVLGVFLLFGGLKGEPFAEDFMDLYDTLLQKLGFKHDSVELQLTQMFDHIMPGSSQWIMRGALDPLALGGTVSSRVSLGDMIPLTGAFREGADWGRELNSALGPAWSANQAGVEWAWTLTQYVTQLLGLGDKTLTIADVIHQTPFAGVRATGEAALMAATGQITDSQGRLISDNVNVGTIFMRALGFYPLEATRANDAVRLDRFHIGYMRAVRARYILAYANAYRLHDQAGMARVEDYVNNWNRWADDANRADMKINNFRASAQRAGEAGSSTTIERAVDSASANSLVEQLAQILNADATSNVNANQADNN